MLVTAFKKSCSGDPRDFSSWSPAQYGARRARPSRLRGDLRVDLPA